MYIHIVSTPMQSAQNLENHQASRCYSQLQHTIQHRKKAYPNVYHQKRGRPSPYFIQVESQNMYSFVCFLVLNAML